MTSKLYVKYFIGIVVIFVLFHFLSWRLVTKNIFGNDESVYVGDLGRLSYSLDSLQPRKSEETLSRKYKVFLDYSHADVITIGDSFSRGDAGGKNANYQDFIATKYDLDVVNVSPSDAGYIETVLKLNSSGALDKLQPKAIILESVERLVITRFSKKINWDIKSKPGELLATTTDKFIPHIPSASFINHNNYMTWVYRALYHYSDNAFVSKVYKAQLVQDFFSAKDKRTLLYIYEDLDSIKKSNMQSVYKVNENLNYLQSILKDKNIQLYFLPAADKYNVYSKYIIDNKHDESNLFELLRGMKKNYFIIDTKAILQKLTDRGLKDIYYSDDTHWTSIASEEIIDNTNF